MQQMYRPGRLQHFGEAKAVGAAAEEVAMT
jgi:hypothetical protein